MGGNENKDVDVTFTRAVGEYRAGRLAQAERLIERVLQGNADHPMALNLFAAIAVRRGQPSAALSHAERAISISPNEPDFHFTRANSLLALDRTEDAEAAFEKAVALNPHHHKALSNLGAMALRSGRFNRALRLLQRATELDPSNAYALNNLGVALQEKGDQDSALAAFDRAIALHPHYAEAHNNRGTLLHKRGLLEEAAAAFERSLSLKPRSPRAMINLGNIRMDQKRRPEAIGVYRRAIDLAPRRPGVHCALARALATEGLLDEADLRLEEALRLDPKHLESLCLSGWVAWNKGSRDAACQRYKKALEVNPQHFNSHYYLACALYDQKDPGPAAAAFRKALEIRPYHATARFYLAVCLFDQGLEDLAIKHFNKVEKHPGGFGFLVDSWRHMTKHRSSGTRSLACTFETLKHGIDSARSDGLVLEFGVLHGRTLNFIADHVEGTVHGFDSFEGIPEAWGGNPKGSYSTFGRLPSLKSGTVLHPGWFDDTLGEFVSQERSPIRFMNVDCDLYSSTATIFHHLGKQIMPGSVIVFDEYLCTARWRDDEFRAFQEAALENNWHYEYLAYNLFSKQASIRIKA